MVERPAHGGSHPRYHEGPRHDDPCPKALVFRQHRADIVLCLLDMTMPVMDGETTLRALRQLAPTLPVILTSGDAGGNLAGCLSGREPTGFLQKPYNLKTLTAAMQPFLRPGRAD